MTLKELLEQATPLPWESYNNGEGVPLGTAFDAAGRAFAKRSDRDLALHAVNMLPKLVEALEKIASATRIDRLNKTYYEWSDLKLIARNALAEANNPEVK